MQELKERIQKEGKVLPGNIVKVDGFLNHRVDCQLMGRMADEFARRGAIFAPGRDFGPWSTAIPRFGSRASA